MLSLSRLHKWLFSCVLVVSLAGVSEVHSYQSNTLTAQTELILKQFQDNTSTYHISWKFDKEVEENKFSFKQFISLSNKLVCCKLTSQTNELLNSFYNYQLNYSQLLLLVSSIDLVA